MKSRNILKSVLVMAAVVLLLVASYLWIEFTGIVERQISQAAAVVCFFIPIVLCAGAGVLWLFNEIDKMDSE